jgi:hypothetical protein
MDGIQVFSATTEMAGLTARAIARKTATAQKPKATDAETGNRVALRAWRKWFPLFVEKAKLHQQRYDIYRTHGFDKFLPNVDLEPGSSCTIAFNSRDSITGWISRKLNRRTKKGAAEADRLLRDWRNASRRSARLREKTRIATTEGLFREATTRLAIAEGELWGLPPGGAISVATIAFLAISKALDVHPKWGQPGIVDCGAWWQIETLRRLMPDLPDELSTPLKALIVAAERDPNIEVCRALHEVASCLPAKVRSH